MAPLFRPPLARALVTLRRGRMTRKKSAVAALLLLLTAIGLLSAQNAEKQQKKDDTIKVDVDLVTVSATVTDPQNRYVTGLDKEHFKLWEDKLEQEIRYFSAEDVPI